MGSDQELPRCSVIVPTRGRPEQLAECLSALAALDYPRDRLEAIVVDDGGGESALEPLLTSLGNRLEIRLIRRVRGGPAAARNTGADQARGELLLFTDDDCRPAPDWLRRLAEEHADAPDVAIGGHTHNALPANPYATVSQLIIDAGYARHNVDRSDARFFTSNNLAVPATGYHQLGGFTAQFTTSEDRDFCDRWVESGRRMHYVPAAVVHHAHRLTLRGFWRQHFAYGRGARQFHREHRMRTGARIELEPGFYGGLHRTAWRGRRLPEALKLQLIIVVWHVANAAGFAWECVSPRGRGFQSGPVAPSSAERS
jgi:cellulose synthase/poly-beta-1,6-N-acetylglucosamine synthase-like glycosyltransferase